VPGNDAVIIKFVATQASTDEQDEFIVTGVASADGSAYLTFQRSLPIGGKEDWGVHIEYADQINSGYAKIARCLLGRHRLQVDLTEPIDPPKTYHGLDVELRICDADWAALARLQRVFTGHDAVFAAEDPTP
jgi:hypothetical protein